MSDGVPLTARSAETFEEFLDGAYPFGEPDAALPELRSSGVEWGSPWHCDQPSSPAAPVTSKDFRRQEGPLMPPRAPGAWLGVLCRDVHQQRRGGESATEHSGASAHRPDSSLLCARCQLRNG